MNRRYQWSTRSQVISVYLCVWFETQMKEERTHDEMNDEEEKKCRIIAFGWKNCNCSLCTCHTIRYKSEKLYPFWAVYAVCACVCLCDRLAARRRWNYNFFYLPDNYAMQNVTKIVSDFQVAVRKKGLLSWVAKKQPHSNAHHRKKWRRTQVKKRHTSALSHQITNSSTTCNKHHDDDRLFLLAPTTIHMRLTHIARIHRVRSFSIATHIFDF